MTDYRQLAVIYLKHNRKRCLVTVMGVALCVIILFVIMNLGVSYIVTRRDAQREKTDYEAYFICRDRETAEQIAGEDCLRKARLEVCEDPEGESSLYTVYVNFRQPYRLLRYADKIAEKHGIGYEVSELAAYYLQDEENNMIYILILAVLLVAFIFAILGVGTVRNSIQLITLEQVKDYGILRCIGATRRQLRGCIYLMGMILELFGIILGTILGFLVYLIPAKTYHLQIGFHVIALPFILAAFLGDLYFVMQENCRFLNNLTPAAAVSGEFQIKREKEKIRAGRGKGIGKLLGFEGSYAYKSLMRNPSRFWKTTGSVGFGIAMIVVAFAINQCVNTYVSGVAAHFGFYQIFGYHTGSFLNGDSEAVRAAEEIMAQLEESPNITESKPVYAADLYTADFAELTDHYTQEYASDSLAGTSQMRLMSRMRDGETTGTELGLISTILISQISLFGYDEEDFDRLKSELAEGTLDVSDEGLVLVNHSYTTSNEIDYYGNIMKDYTMYHYHVGDRITFVDFQKLDELLGELDERTEKGEFTVVVQDPGTGELQESIDQLKRITAYYEGYQELLAKGETKTYTIEGILRKDSVLSRINGYAHFVLPQEQYFRLTGREEGNGYGRMYHMKGTRTDETLNRLYKAAEERQAFSNLAWEPLYLTAVQNIDRFRSVILAVVFFALFVVMMNILNILNASASNLHLRRREFAQLRVLGMSKKLLQKTVLLEGVITGIAASIAGLVLGAGITGMVVYLLNLLIYVEFHFPWGAYAATAAASIFLLCGSICLNLRSLKTGMAEELSASGR